MYALFTLLTDNLGYLLLAGAFYLFYFDRNAYRRQDLSAKAWTTVLLYNLLSLGAYGMFWRLRATYVLTRGKRYPGMAWLLLIFVTITFQFSPFLGWIFLTLWDLTLRAILRDDAKIDSDVLYVVLFGHLALAHVCFIHKDELPADLGPDHASLQSYYVRSFAKIVAALFIITSLGYAGVYVKRMMDFNPQPDQAVGITSDRQGYWSETSEGSHPNEVVYVIDAQGHKKIFDEMNMGVQRSESWFVSYPSSVHPTLSSETEWSWFGCVTQKRIIEQNENRLVTENAEGDRRIAVRIEPEQFREKTKNFKGQALTSQVWMFKQFIQSPWDCLESSPKPN